MVRARSPRCTTRSKPAGWPMQSAPRRAIAPARFRQASARRDSCRRRAVQRLRGVAGRSPIWPRGELIDREGPAGDGRALVRRGRARKGSRHPGRSRQGRCDASSSGPADRGKASSGSAPRRRPRGLYSSRRVATAALAMFDFETALRTYRSALDIDPNLAEAWLVWRFCTPSAAMPPRPWPLRARA